jgi:hypothetical protein
LTLIHQIQVLAILLRMLFVLNTDFDLSYV